jgi:hypothetical protein
MLLNLLQASRGGNALPMHQLDTAKDRLKKNRIARRDGMRLSAATQHLFGVGDDVINRGLDRTDLLCFFIGNFGLELFFEGHDQLDGVQGIGAQIVHERGLVLDVLQLYAQLFGYDLLDPFFDSTHFVSPLGVVAMFTARSYRRTALLVY